jgi:hypothetical protein
MRKEFGVGVVKALARIDICQVRRDNGELVSVSLHRRNLQTVISGPGADAPG